MFSLRKISLTVILVSLLITLLPNTSFAASCLCNGVKRRIMVVAGEARTIETPVTNICLKNDTPGLNAPISAQYDCTQLGKNNWSPISSVTCLYSSDNDCTASGMCSGKPCTATEVECKSNPDPECDKLKATNGSTSVAECKFNKCYLDNISYERYKNTPSLLGIKADLQLRQPSFEIRIPGLKFTDIGEAIDSEGYLHIPYLGEFISLIYKLAMGLGSIVAVVMIIAQALKVIVSEGGDLKSEAYNRIGQIVIGLVILWGSYAILYTINPELVQFRVLKVKYIETVPLIDVIDEPVINVPITMGTNNVPMYKQFSSEWAKLRYGDESACTTIHAAGCGPSSLAMVLSFYGSQVTPDRTAAWMGHKGNGRLCNRGTSMEATVANLPNSPWSNFRGRSVSKTEALNFLNQNKPIIFLCRDCTGSGRAGPKSYGGHYLVLTGMDSNGNVTVNDSGANDQKAILNMSTEQLNKNGGFWIVQPSSN